MSTGRQTVRKSTPSDVGGVAISNRHRWGIVGLLFAASMVNYFDRATISIALPVVAHDLGLGPEQKGLLLSSFFWSYALMQIPIGWCADHVNLKWLYAAAFAVWSLAQGLTGLAGTLASLIGFRILLGVGESIYLPGGTKIVSLLFSHQERGFPAGIFDFGTRTGLVVEGILVPWLLRLYGWRHTFLLVGFIALIWLIPWLLVFPSSVRANRRQTTFGAGARANGMAEILRGLGNRNLFGICLGFFCFDYYWYVFVTWLPDYLVTVRHLSVAQAGLYASLAFFTFGVTEPIGGWIGDWLVARGWNETRTRKGIVTVAFVLGLLLIAALRFSDTRMALGLLIGSCLVGLATGNLIVILQCCAPPDQVGIWTGAENFAGNLSGIIAPLAVGLLIKWTGSYVPGLALSSMVLIAGLLAYWSIVGELKCTTSGLPVTRGQSPKRHQPPHL